MRIRRIVAGLAALVLALSPVHAQTSKSTLSAAVASQFPDQNTGAITPATTRTFLNNLINSFQQFTGVNQQPGTTYTVAPSDYGQVIVTSNSSAKAITLPQAVGSFFPFNFFINNTGAGSATVTPQGGSLIGGSATLVIPQNANQWIISDGTNYQIFPAIAGIAASSLTGTTGFFTNTMLAQMNARTLKCNATSGSASPADCTSQQAAPFLKTAQAGFITIYYDSVLAQWVYQKPDGTVITAASSTCQIQEALTYAFAANYSVQMFGQSAGNQCTITSTGITVPASYGSSFSCNGVNLNFASMAGTNGITFDTQRYGAWLCNGSLINYRGTGTAYVIQPRLSPTGAACTAGDTNCWALDYNYELGTIFMQTASANACIFIDISQGNGVNQLRSSAWGNNTIHFICEGQGNANYGLQWASPVNTFQAGTENAIYFENVEGATVAQIKIGGSSSNDQSIGFNHYRGNIATTGNVASNTGITTDASSDVFDLLSINCYQSVGSQVNVNWGTNAGANLIRTAQALACGGGTITDNSTAKTNNIILLPSQLPLPRLVSALPTCAAALEGWQYVVTNNNTAAAWNGAVTNGGALVSTIKCDGTSWKQF